MFKRLKSFVRGLNFKPFVRPKGFSLSANKYAVVFFALFLVLVIFPEPHFGYWNTKHVRDSFILFRQPNLEKMSRIIRRHRSGRKWNLSDRALAKKILTVSECLEIDAYVFSSLIYQESSFNPRAISSTYAMGLTQFTTAGLREANLQMGYGVIPGARLSTIQYFNRRIRDCIVPRLGMGTFTPLWVYHPDRHEQKNILLQNPDYAVIYGGVLLKTLLAVQKGLNSRQKMIRHYRNALKLYNGDPKEKERYQSKIVTVMYRFRKI